MGYIFERGGEIRLCWMRHGTKLVERVREKYIYIYIYIYIYLKVRASISTEFVADKTSANPNI